MKLSRGNVEGVAGSGRESLESVDQCPASPLQVPREVGHRAALSSAQIDFPARLNLEKDPGLVFTVPAEPGGRFIIRMDLDGKALPAVEQLDQEGKSGDIQAVGQKPVGAFPPEGV
jgi:hypothetical protein